MIEKVFSQKKAGFTLIELLIVVAIIAILAAIAVPNFLEAQTRAKVSRAKADLRTIATGLESYYVDNNRYPPTPFYGGSGVLRVVPTRLSTPIAYLSSANFLDGFVDATLGDFQFYPPSGNKLTYGPTPNPLTDPESSDPIAGRRYYYQYNNDERRSPGTLAALREGIPYEGQWVMASMGPDRKRDYETAAPAPRTVTLMIPYDPTNGTISNGDILRMQIASEGTYKN